MTDRPALGAVLVTGASTGIGRATALRLDSLGFTVFAGVRKLADGDALGEAGSGRLVPVSVDVTEPAQITAAGEAIAASGLPLVGLVNNAGIAAAAPLEFVPIADFRHQLEVNVVAQLAVTQAVIPMLREARGRIINITSIGGLIAGAMLGPYHASKFAFEAMTDTLRVELAPWGIHVVAIEPGRIATPIWATSAARADRMATEMPAAAFDLYGRRIEVAKRGAAAATASGLNPDEVAKTVARALTTRRPRTRYPVGMDAKVGSAIIARLPDRLRDRVLSGRR